MYIKSILGANGRKSYSLRATHREGDRVKATDLLYLGNNYSEGRRKLINADWLSLSEKDKLLIQLAKHESRYSLPWGEFPHEVFDVIVIDPPWRYELRQDDATHRGRVGYSTLSIEEIKQCPVPEMCSSWGTIVFLWFTNNFLIEAGECLREWNLVLKTVLTWEKVTRAGNTRIGVGHWLRNATEHCAIATFGPVPSFRTAGTMTNQSTLLKAERGIHSAKPDEFYSLVNGLVPNATKKIDIFSRRSRDGWQAWGEEAGKLDNDGVSESL